MASRDDGAFNTTEVIHLVVCTTLIMIEDNYLIFRLLIRVLLNGTGSMWLEGV